LIGWSSCSSKTQRKLYVVGHTGNIVGQAANLDLSKRRAESVLQAIVTLFRL
jgi:outer membrane protein OmpA-like peptidoglycan-associated protein